MTEPEGGTAHTEAHGVHGLMESHEHLHGTGEGQHSHEGWTPDRVIERMKRDGFCGFRVPGKPRVVEGEKTIPGMDTYCMNLAGQCAEHDGLT